MNDSLQIEILQKANANLIQSLRARDEIIARGKSALVDMRVAELTKERDHARNEVARLLRLLNGKQAT